MDTKRNRDEAKKALDHAKPGEFIVRPSSQGENTLAVTLVFNLTQHASNGWTNSKGNYVFNCLIDTDGQLNKCFIDTDNLINAYQEFIRDMLQYASRGWTFSNYMEMVKQHCRDLLVNNEYTRPEHRRDLDWMPKELTNHRP